MESGTMDLPITKPTMMAYADQLDFSQLLGELSQTKKNGFVRVTSGSEEGYLLFKDGEQVAASYDNLSKLEAVDKIKLSMEDYKTLVEVFDVRPAQIPYLMDLNKAHLLEKVQDIDEVLEELKKEPAEDETSEEAKETLPGTGSEAELPVTPDPDKTWEAPESSGEPSVETLNKLENTVTAEPSPEIPTPEVAVDGTVTDVEKEIRDESPRPSSPNTGQESAVKTSPETSAEAFSQVMDKISSTPTEVPELKTAEEETRLEENEISHIPNDDDPGIPPLDDANTDETAVDGSPETENEEPLDRMELLKKYGIKDINEEEVEKVLGSYTGGYLSDNDVEKVELTLMNRVKKSIMGLPKVKGTEVMIFLDNAGNDLKGNINVIMEYQSQGFFSRIVGESKEINKLKRQVIGICNMEIRKIFREYPEVVDKFEVNVEIS